MAAALTQSRPRMGSVVWAGLAVLVGIVVARLPLVVVGGGVSMVALCLVIMIEPALGLVVMLSVAPLKTLMATELSLALPVDVGQICLGLVVVTWALWRITRWRFTPLPRTRLYLPLIVFIAGFSPSLFSAVSAGAWLAEMLKWIEMLLLVVIVLDLGRTGRWSWIAFGVVTAGVLQALIGLYEYRGGSGAPHLWIDFRNFRAFGTFGQPNPFSAFMGLTLPLALGLAWGYGGQGVVRWREARRQDRVSTRAEWAVSGALALVYGFCGMLLLGGLIASWGRGAWTGFGAAALVMVFFAPRKRRYGVLLLAACGMLAATLWLTGYVPLSIQQRIDNALNEFTGFGDMRAVPISGENFAIVERLAHWQAAYYMASDHPFVGVGLGNYEAVYHEYGLPSWPRALGHAHNDYLNTLAETGLLGLAAYLAGWGAVVYWSLRALEQSDLVIRGLVLGLLGTWTHLAVHSIVDKLYVNNLFLHIGVMLGLLAVACDYTRQPVEE